MSLRETADLLREYALGFPGAHEDHPWGELVIKVKGKVFVFLGHAGELEESLGFSVKLPRSGERLLDEPWATPTHYGLGKSGWVTLSFTSGELPERGELCAWIEESYRAVAPKTLVKELDQGGSAPARRPAAGKGPARAAKKPARKPRRR